MAGRTSDLVARVGLVTLMVAPPAVAGVDRGSAAAHHPLATAGTLVAYEALVVVVGFAGRVFGDLQARWVERVADGLDRRLLWRTSRFEEDYRRHVHGTHRFIDVKGLATRGDYTPWVEEVFVDVSLAPRPAHQAARESLAGTVPASGALATTRQSVGAFLDGPEGTSLAVIGAPGTGKTTLLKHLALRLTGTGRARARARRDLPVLLYLRDHAAAITEDPELTLPAVVRRSLHGLAAGEPEGWFERQLRDGRCLVLLDGLDEVASEADRRRVSAWVERQIAAHQRNDFVVTSRPHGYQTAPVNGARVLQVRRFTGEQIARFLHGWYRAIERLSTREDSPDVHARASAEAEDLLGRLRDRPVLYDLAANPLLLTMTANVHRYRGALPGSRAELYAEICQVLLWRRAEAKNVPGAEDDVPGNKKEAVLRELAYAMMTARQRDIGADRAAELLEPLLSRIAPDATPTAFLDTVVASGLLVEREHGVFALAHLTLQEHLAALHVQHHRLVDTLAEAVEDDWWRETTLLYAARVDPTPIVEACLASGSTRALALAFECADEAVELQPDAAERLEELRRQALDQPASSPRRQLLTAVTVTRQLRDTIRLGDDTQVTARPVSWEMWRLFAADHGLPARGPVEGAEDAPAVGITRTEAQALVDWVNELLPDGTAYRLPKQEEVADPAFALTARSPAHTVWYAPPGLDAPLELWVPEGVEHPWRVRLTVPTELPRIHAVGLVECLVARAGRIRQSVERVRGLGRRLDIDLDGVLVPALISALRSAHDLDQSMADGRPTGDAAHALNRELGVALACTEDFTRALDNFRDPYPGRDLAIVLDHLRGLVRSLARALGSVEEIVSAAVASPQAPNFGPEWRRHELAAAITPVLAMLDGPQDTAARPVRNAAEFLRLAAKVLAPQASVDREPHTVFPDQISAFLDTANSRLRSEYPLGQPAGRVIRTLAQVTAVLVAPYGSSPEHTGVSNTPFVHTAALTLAAAVDRVLDAPDVSGLYRRVAAGALALSRRADGTVPPSETVVLVRV